MLSSLEGFFGPSNCLFFHVSESLGVLTLFLIEFFMFDRVFYLSLYVKISQILEVFCVYDSFISVYLIDWCVWWMFLIIDIFFVLFSESELRREISRLGTTTARLKPKGIDGGLHKRWSMWFNSTQRAKPYQFLT